MVELEYFIGSVWLYALSVESVNGENYIKNLKTNFTVKFSWRLNINDCTLT